MKDQAEGLRRLAARRERGLAGPGGSLPAEEGGRRPGGIGGRIARVLTVTSGKGGVGKTHLAVNLSLAFHQLGQEVALVDADLGLANADLLLGVHPRWHLGDVLGGRCTAVQALEPAPGGIHLLAGASGLVELAHADQAALRRLVSQLRLLDRQVDLVVVDTGAGLGRPVLSLVGAAREVLLVVTPEPTSLTDAYSLVKVAAPRNGAARWYLVINMAARPSEAWRVAERLAGMVGRHLGVHLTVAGCVPKDEAVGQAALRQVPLLLDRPGSAAARAIREVAARLMGVPPPPGGGISGALWRWLAGRGSRPISSGSAAAWGEAGDAPRPMGLTSRQDRFGRGGS